MRSSEFRKWKDDKEDITLFVKFVDSRYLEDLLSGNLFMNPLKVFIEQELREQKRGQGDKFEGGVVGAVTNFRMYDYETDELVHQFNGPSIFNLQHPDVQKIPVFCFTAFKKEDFEVLEVHEDYAVCGLSIPGSDKEKFIENFGDKAVLLPKDFPQLVCKTITDDHFGMVKDVNYVDYSIGMVKEQIQDFNEGNLGIAYWKDKFFEYQREARFAFSTMPQEKAFKYNIGSILQGCSVLDTKDFFDQVGFILKFD
ncbi:hypothetical protein [Paenibacillus antibioticophila]|uniref:hypothetical protein n=1 Tax=Paenibacillus antibioticophila TaxID=1274374 RepID=UPI0005C802DE|nr:hypothetical protein [Paenibacillus antibioticophila]